jgi:hypothetical protein
MFDILHNCIDTDKCILKHPTVVHNPKDENNSDNTKNCIQPPQSAERNTKMKSCEKFPILVKFFIDIPSIKRG